MCNEYNNGEAWFNFAFATRKHSTWLYALLWLIAVICFSSCTTTQEDRIIIREQGSFTVGGSVVTNPGKFDAIEQTPEGQTFHGDHAYVFYQIPDNARKLCVHPR